MLILLYAYVTMEGDVPATEGYIPTIEQVQEALIAAGYDCGEIDGMMGPKTLEAWEKWEMNQWGIESYEFFEKEKEWKD